MAQKKPNKRIYVVEEVSGERFLVRASNKAQAVRYVVRNTYLSHVATQDEIVVLVALGQPVEDAVETEDDEAQQVAA